MVLYPEPRGRGFALLRLCVRHRTALPPKSLGNPRNLGTPDTGTSEPRENPEPGTLNQTEALSRRESGEFLSYAGTSERSSGRDAGFAGRNGDAYPTLMFPARWSEGPIGRWFFVTGP